MRKRRLLAAVPAAALLACFAGAGAASAAKSFVYCTADAPHGYDSALYSDQTVSDAVGNTVYQRLVGLAPGGEEIIPVLAESWEISPDEKTYIFHLRKGVKFQKTAYFTPKRDFNADDVLFSFQRQADKANPYHAYEKGQGYQYYDDMGMARIIKEVRKKDDYTVEIELYQPEAPFMADMTMDFLSIVSKEYADKLLAEGRQGDLNLWPIGTGPFYLAAKQKDVALRYKAHENYWRGKPPIDNLIYSFNADGIVRSQNMRAGNCDLMFSPPLMELPALKADKNLKIVEQPSMSFSYFPWNTLKPPFNNKEVRKALNMAINRDMIFGKIYQGAVAPANSPLPPAMFGYDKAIPQVEYNPAKAREILAREGVKNLEFNFYTFDKGGLIGNPKLIGEVLQSFWKDIGVKVNIVQLEFVELLKIAQDRSRDGISYNAWVSDNGDPDNILGILFKCDSQTSNASFFCDARYDALIKAGRSTYDRAKRAEYYKQAQELLYEEQPILLFGYFKDTAVLRKNVTGFKLLPHGLSFEGVDKN